jgi:hypothetical protein
MVVTQNKSSQETLNYGTEKSILPIEISTLKQPEKKIVMHQRAMEIKSI